MSYNAMASSLATEKSISVSKQALHLAMRTQAFVQFCKAVFDDILRVRLIGQKAAKKGCFKRILIQDSSVIRLPQRLFELFGGIKNATTQVANGRVQFVLDILSNCISSFQLNGYKDNDQKAAPDLEIEPKDLVLRDRGYFVLLQISRIEQAKAFFIYR